MGAGVPGLSQAAGTGAEAMRLSSMDLDDDDEEDESAPVTPVGVAWACLTCQHCAGGAPD